MIKGDSKIIDNIAINILSMKESKAAPSEGGRVLMRFRFSLRGRLQ